MRTILMSLKKDVYDRVLSGEKIYEHRKVFPDEPVKAYIYVSAPIKAICGIMYLNNKTSLLDWKKKFSHDIHAIERIDKYLKNYKFGMEITRFENTNAIPLDNLRNDLSKFIVPQMYYFIEDSELLSYLEKNLVLDGTIVTHTYENVTSDMICKS